jgi:hypothetical protein
MSTIMLHHLRFLLDGLSGLMLPRRPLTATFDEEKEFAATHSEKGDHCLERKKKNELKR